MFMVKPVPPLPSHNSEKDLTERFSEHFINKITNLRENHAKCPSPSQAEINTKSCTSFFSEFNEVTMETVRTVIESSPSKSCPSDPMPTKTLKSCLNELLPVITTLETLHYKRASSQMHLKRASCTRKSRRHQWTRRT